MTMFFHLTSHSVLLAALCCFLALVFLQEFHELQYIGAGSSMATAGGIFFLPFEPGMHVCYRYLGGSTPRTLSVATVA